MRTKTLALSAVLGMLGTASVLAQNVYSINAVGYINLTLLPGYNIVTCPLIASPDNTLNTLFPNVAPNYTYQNTTVYQFAGGHFTSQDSGLGSYVGGGWINGGADVTLNPGQAVFVLNGNASPNSLNTGEINVTFVGTVPQGTLTTTLTPGYNLVGSQVPYSGDLAINAGVSPNNFPNLNGGFYDYIYFYNPAWKSGKLQQGYENQVAEGGTYNPGWTGGTGPNGDPDSPTVTTGFYFFNNSTARGGPPANETWTEIFSINP